MGVESSQEDGDKMETQSALSPVKVIWVDSHCWPTWEDAQEISKTAASASLKCMSVGMLVSDEEDRIVITQSVSFDGPDVRNMANTLAIPKSCIQKIYGLGKGKNIMLPVEEDKSK